MRQQEILKKIGGIIAELKDQHTYLEAAETSFNELELELFMANAHFLTDHIGILQKINHQPATGALAASKPVLQLPENHQKPVIPDYFAEQDLLAATEPLPFSTMEVEIIELNSAEILPIKEAIILPEVMPQELVLPQPESLVLPEAASPTESVEHLKADASFTDQKSVPEQDLEAVAFELKDTASKHFPTRPETVSLDIEPETVSDFNITSGRDTESAAEPAFFTLNDRIAAQKDTDLPKTKPEQFKQNQDLQAMISLNDKLLFVKELFNGYNLAYAEAISILNRYTSFEQAENFLNQNYAAKNNWKDKPLTTDKFMNLLRQKQKAVS